MPIPASLREGDGRLRVLSWLQPQGPAASGEAQPVPARRLPHSSRMLTEDGTESRRSESPKLPTSKQTPSGNCSCSSREPSSSLGSVFGAAGTDSVLFTPMIDCGKYPNPTFSAQNNSVIKTILAIIPNVQSDTRVLPGEILTYQKSWRSQGLVKKHSLIFHNSKKVYYSNAIYNRYKWDADWEMHLHTLNLQDSQTVRILPCHTKAHDLPTQSTHQAHLSLGLWGSLISSAWFAYNYAESSKRE